MVDLIKNKDSRKVSTLVCCQSIRKIVPKTPRLGATPLGVLEIRFILVAASATPTFQH